MGTPIEKLPFKEFLEQEIQSWSKFRRTLRKEDQLIFDRLFEKAKVHVEAGGLVSRPWPFDVVLISILLEHEKEMEELRKKLEDQAKEVLKGVR